MSKETPVKEANAKKHGVAAVQSTDKYDLFKTVDSNREVQETHVTRLMRAIGEKNLLHLNPIIVNGNNEVIDGQHRLEAAKRLKLPIYYIKDSDISKKDISKLNTNKKNWSMMDYVNFFCIEGVPEYIEFSKLCNKYPKFKLSWIHALCSENGRRSVNDLKDGLLDISNKDLAEEYMGYMMDYAKYIPTVYSSRFIEGFVMFLSKMDYDHDEMVKKIAGNQDLIEPCVRAKDYKNMLRKIWRAE